MKRYKILLLLIIFTLLMGCENKTEGKTCLMEEKNNGIHTITVGILTVVQNNDKIFCCTRAVKGTAICVREIDDSWGEK